MISLQYLYVAIFKFLFKTCVHTRLSVCLY